MEASTVCFFFRRRNSIRDNTTTAAMRAAAATLPTPMPALAPVLSPLGCVVGVGVPEADVVAVPVLLEAEDVAEAVGEVVVFEGMLPGDLDVDVGLKPFTYVMEPPAETGSVWKNALSVSACARNVARKETPVS